LSNVDAVKTRKVDETQGKGAGAVAPDDLDTGFKGAHNHDFDGTIKTMAAKYRVPARLIKSVIAAESSFNPAITSGAKRSSAGAIGAMQLMPGTARELGVQNPNDPQQNIEGGTKYLASLLNRYRGDVTKAVAAYNAGPGAVNKYDGVPPFGETKIYVAKVLGAYRGTSTVDVGAIRDAGKEWAASQPQFAPRAGANRADSPWMYGVPDAEDDYVRMIDIHRDEPLAALVARLLLAMGISNKELAAELIADPKLLAALVKAAPKLVATDVKLALDVARTDPSLLAGAINTNSALSATLTKALNTVDPETAATVKDGDAVALADAVVKADPKKLSDALGSEGQKVVAAAIAMSDPTALARAIAKAQPDLAVDTIVKADPRRAFEVLKTANDELLRGIDKVNPGFGKQLERYDMNRLWHLFGRAGVLHLPSPTATSGMDTFDRNPIAARPQVNIHP
jgi:hypothetical protein